LDQRAIAHASANIIEPGAVTVEAVKFRDWLRCHDERAEVALGATKDRLIASIGGRSSLQLRTLPETDFPRPFDVNATAGCRLTETEHRRLFKETVSVIPTFERRPALCGFPCAARIGS